MIDKETKTAARKKLALRIAETIKELSGQIEALGELNGRVDLEIMQEDGEQLSVRGLTGEIDVDCYHFERINP
jgi:type VI protein secretion system component VasA